MGKKGSSSEPSSFSRYVGNNAFPNEQPVCKPIVPGRRIKPLSGPVHPGFKGKPTPPPRYTPPANVIVRSDKNDDLYQRPKKK